MGRAPSAGVGALAFNYFHTQPLLSFAVAARQDAISVILLAVVGGIVGETAARATALRRRAAAERSTMQRFDRLIAVA